MTIEPPFGAPNIKSFPNEVSRETGAMRDASRSGAGLAFGHKNGVGAKVRANGYGVFAEGSPSLRSAAVLPIELWYTIVHATARQENP